MHERSLVKTLLKQADQIARENDAANVAEVSVEIGPLSGVEVELVKTAFEELSPSSKLKVIEVPLTVRCTRCHAESDLTDFVFRCDSCGSGEVKVISGDEFRLISLTLAAGATYAT